MHAVCQYSICRFVEIFGKSSAEKKQHMFDRLGTTVPLRGLGRKWKERERLAHFHIFGSISTFCSFDLATFVPIIYVALNYSANR